MSRPSPSVPSQCAALGGMRRSSMSMSVALGIGRTSAAMASARIAPIQPIASQKMTPSCPHRRRRVVLATAVSVLTSSATMTDPRVKHGLEQVDEEVHHHEADGDEQQGALQDDDTAR